MSSSDHSSGDGLRSSSGSRSRGRQHRQPMRPENVHCDIEVDHSPCKGVYTSRQGLAQHRKRVLEHRQRKPKYEQCMYCQKQFNRPFNCHRHEKSCKKRSGPPQTDSDPWPMDISASPGTVHVSDTDSYVSGRSGFSTPISSPAELKPELPSFVSASLQVPMSHLPLHRQEPGAGAAPPSLASGGASAGGWQQGVSLSFCEQSGVSRPCSNEILPARNSGPLPSKPARSLGQPTQETRWAPRRSRFRAPEPLAVDNLSCHHASPVPAQPAMTTPDWISQTTPSPRRANPDEIFQAVGGGAHAFVGYQPQQVQGRNVGSSAGGMQPADIAAQSHPPPRVRPSVMPAPWWKSKVVVENQPSLPGDSSQRAGRATTTMPTPQQNSSRCEVQMPYFPGMANIPPPPVPPAGMIPSPTDAPLCSLPSRSSSQFSLHRRHPPLAIAPPAPGFAMEFAPLPLSGSLHTPQTLGAFPSARLNPFDIHPNLFGEQSPRLPRGTRVAEPELIQSPTVEDLASRYGALMSPAAGSLAMDALWGAR